ncbi:MAG: 3-isopropylmalate dehydrogenase [Desulfonatronovibrionaceae bacterium]
MSYKLAVLSGDGIGPEIVRETVRVLDAVAEKSGFLLEKTHGLIGGAAVDATKGPLPKETVDVCRKSDAVLLGAVGGPKWDGLDPALRPEKGLLGIRKELGLFANLRPACTFPDLAEASLLRADIAAKGLDLLVVRELTGGIYFGEPRGERHLDGQRAAYNTMIYTESEVRRIARIAFEAAEKRRKMVCSVDKANVLEVSRLWREVVEEVAKEYPHVQLTHMYVDNAAMQLVRDPSQFDVLVTGNLFGDILSDEAAVITGSIGLLASASLGESGPGLFEPIHGSAPDIAGQNAANPLAAVLSGAMLLRFGLGLEKEAELVEKAVHHVLDSGFRTKDIMQPGKKALGCTEMGDKVCEALDSLA